ncbi:acid-shock protein, partial [Dickeya solani]|nr:acid-shock protein [Dickeya solani]MZH09960.1 acid-shock protein [Dickeya solani]MZI96985.1 acid-shock protein [Dickeya solani]
PAQKAQAAKKKVKKAKKVATPAA